MARYESPSVAYASHEFNLPSIKGSDKPRKATPKLTYSQKRKSEHLNILPPNRQPNLNSLPSPTLPTLPRKHQGALPTLRRGKQGAVLLGSLKSRRKLCIYIYMYMGSGWLGGICPPLFVASAPTSRYRAHKSH